MAMIRRFLLALLSVLVFCNAGAGQQAPERGAAGGGWSCNANVEATYDWEGDQWTVPAIVNVSKVINVGGRMMSLLAGPRYYVEAPEQGPEWGFRLQLTLLFPR